MSGDLRRKYQTLTIDLDLEHRRVASQVVLQLEPDGTIVQFAGVLDGQDGVALGYLRVEPGQHGWRQGGRVSEVMVRPGDKMVVVYM